MEVARPGYSQIRRTKIVVYTKLPGGFLTPTPVGNCNPGWAIAFQEDKGKHICFVAETRGSMLSLEFREIQKDNIQCARKFFAEITGNEVKYDVIDRCDTLMDIIGRATA